METQIDVDERLISLLFNEQKELEVEYQAYLSDLTSFGLEKLQEEPKIHQNQSKLIRQQMEQLAFDNYRSFIGTASCIQDLRQQITKTDQNLNNLLICLPKLSESCKKFCLTSQSLSETRNLNKLTLQYHTQLLELLEIPQWMDTCVRNGFYDECLELQAYAQRLASKYPDLPIIQSILTEVNQSKKHLVNQLNQKLRANLQLSACLEIIGILRRLEVYNETDLRVCYLRNRDFWLRSLIDALPTSNPYSYLTKLTDVVRGQLFDVITQYQAIFSDESEQYSAVLYCWVTFKIDEFLSTLQRFLPRVSDGGSIHNILDQCMYLGMSMSRVGADFRGLLSSIFETHIITLFNNTLNNSLEQFKDSLKNQKISMFKQHTLVPFNASDKQDPFAPNNRLLDYPPLAVLTNSILSLFNDLRQCAPLSIQFQLTRKLEEILTEINQFIHKKKESNNFGLDEEKAIIEFDRVIVELFIPFIINCFSHLFHSTTSLISIENFHSLK